MILLPISSYARRLLENPPAPGEGRHHWLFKVGRCLRAQRWPANKVKECLADICKAQGWSDRAGKTIDDICAKLDLPLPQGDRLPPWPAPNPGARHARALLTEPRFDAHLDTGHTAQEILPVLFGGNATLCCIGWDTYRFTTMRLLDLLPTAHTAPFIVANAMRDFSADGSKRCRANSCLPENRKWLVVEFDQGEPREFQAAVLSSLHSNDHPLALAVWSGGKSIHGWFNVEALSPFEKLKLFRFAVWLGADSTLWDTSKLVRMPGGNRDGARQTVLYWEPEHA